MRSTVFAAACLLSSVAYDCAAAEPLLISADRIYTAPDVPPLEQGTVLVRDGRIAAVADQHSRIAIPEGTRTSDCRGIVVAGFQNSHVHFTEDVWHDAQRASADSLGRQLEAMLTRYGFTTVFDTGSDQSNTLALRERIQKGEIKGPRILTAGLPLYPVDGIPVYIRDLPPELLARMHQPRDAAGARGAVRANIDAGADGTKLFLHTSSDGSNARFMAPEVARAAAEATHARGKLVLAHPTSNAGVRAALQAGVDIIVHTALGEPAPWDAALTREMVAKNLAVVPTFKLWRYELAKQNVPKQIVDKLVGATLDQLRAFKAAGGQILFGTDVGYMHEYDPGDEYELMSQAGLTPLEILASLTTAPAARWKEEKQRGRVAAGYQADLVVLAADPADDVRNLTQVRCAFRGGEQIYPATALAAAGNQAHASAGQ